MAPLQAKLNVSQPGDALEREADQVAEQVLRMPQPGASVETSDAAPRISRLSESGQGSSEASAAVHDTLRESGQSLDTATRAYFEPRFGRSFDDVRVHTGAAAADSAYALGAKAYTVGSDIVFGERQYAPQTDTGRRLLAHELTHTLQQRQSASATVQRQDEDEMTERGRRFLGRQPPGAQRRDVVRMQQARSAVRSIAKNGEASLGLWPNEADGTVQGFQLTQNFRAEFAPGANPADYAIVQWIKGEMYTAEGGRRAYFPANTALYGRDPTQPWRFTDWIIDTPDADPRFGSNNGLHVTVPVTDFQDAPAFMLPSGTLPAGFRWRVEARMGVYLWGGSVPTNIAGWEGERPRALREVSWGWDLALRPDRRSFTLNIL